MNLARSVAQKLHNTLKCDKKMLPVTGRPRKMKKAR